MVSCDLSILVPGIEVVSVHQLQRLHQRILRHIAMKLNEQSARSIIPEINDQMDILGVATFSGRGTNNKLNRSDTLQ